ncbi:endoplasmic reticulum vesicle transporter-domain-containing protein [Boletus edulis BED1]|uniref:Endoplasmic reticulum vesicle transporter-domain-containing protein n=1 Tax=Boletus edulis BED1 TaxID=1328754 RepID=A0AAD4BM79_BOLED|nr:endoplasmic reticulum vesicle transporter-domain-containing protein [Boletus edulis BED1]
MSAARTSERSLLDKLDSAIPGLARFDAFPKLPSTYKARSESRGFFTLFVIFLAILLVLNDLAEYVWGWPDYEFSVDTQKTSHMNVNVDMVVNTPCSYLSVDLRDAVGDRLFLSKGFRRDGTVFDIGQATALKEHAQALSARQAVSQSRKSRGLLSFFTRAQPDYRPTYNHKADGDACRIYGTLRVKKVTANLHVTTLGHGYSSAVHVPHDKMNLSHVITEFSFGPYFPDIVQPLDYSFELANEPFMAYQYYLHVVPTTYVAPRTKPLHTNQYSVTHYTRKLKEDKSTPGIFFKFDLDPMVITIHQRTTSFVQLFIRCVGVIGGIFTCASYFLRITVRTIEAVSGADSTPGIVAAESTSVKRKWAGAQLHHRTTANTGRVVRQGNGWVVEGAGTPYSATPVPGGFGPSPSPYPYTPYPPTTPAVPPPPPSTSAASTTFGLGPNSLPPTPGVGLGLGAPTFSHSRTPSLMGGQTRPPSMMSGQTGMRSVSGDGPGAAGISLPPSPFMGSVPATLLVPPPPPKSARKDD